MKKLFIVLLVALLLPIALLAQTEQAAQPEGVELPMDIVVWGGVSLSTALVTLTEVLKRTGVIKDKYKKQLGYILPAIGALIATGYAYAAGVHDVLTIVQYFGGGVISGLTAVGLHSSAKNTVQAFK